jgi:hypothetical protein
MKLNTLPSVMKVKYPFITFHTPLWFTLIEQIKDKSLLSLFYNSYSKEITDIYQDIYSIKPKYSRYV